MRALFFIWRYLYAAASCLYLFCGGFLCERHRTFLYAICRHFGLGPSVPDILPKANLWELIDDKVLIDIREPLDDNGGISPLQLMTIAKFIRARKPAAILEIGTFQGRTTLNMAANSEPSCKIYTLDLPKRDLDATALPVSAADKTLIDKDRSGSRFASTELGEKITQLYGDSAKFDFSPYFGKIDLVFVDGAHGYEYVLNDSRIALKLLRGGKGVILWDDYGGSWEGVTKAINELFQREAEFKRLVRLREGGFVCYLKD